VIVVTLKTVLAIAFTIPGRTLMSAMAMLRQLLCGIEYGT
jgi:hypothetical protein